MMRTAFAIALGVALAPLASAAETTLVVGKAAATADALLPADVGKRLGIFEKHGLDVKVVNFEGGSKLVQAMVAGSVDVGDGAGLQMAFVAKGAPIMAVCESTATLPYFAIGVPWDSPITSLQQLLGKKIGVSNAASLTDWMALELTRKEGWPPDAVTRVFVGDGAAASTEALQAHLVDAYIGGTTTFLMMEQRKIARVLTPVSSYIGRVASGMLFATNHLIATDPTALRAFLAGWMETARFMRTHQAETIRIESEVTGFPPSVMSQEYDIVRGMFSDDCRFDSESLTRLGQSLLDLKLVSTPTLMSKLYTEAYLSAR